MKAGEILSAARGAVEGPRGQTHGDKGKNMSHTAALFTAYLGDRLSTPITARDVACLMVLLKVSRVACGTAIDDHFIDMAGYAAIAGEVGQQT